MSMSTLGFVLACVALAFTQAHRNNPIEKAVQMISNLQQMILSQAADAQKTYRKYTAYCEERSQNLMYDIKGEKAEVSSLKAVISSNTAAIGVLRAKIEEISSEISSIDDQEKAADAMRVKEASNFGSEEGELQDMIDSLKQAISIFTKKDGVSLLQAASANSVTEALSALVEASAMSVEDARKLTSLVQEQHGSDDDLDADADDDDALDSWSEQSAAFLAQSSTAKIPPTPGAVPDNSKKPPPPSASDADANSASGADSSEEESLTGHEVDWRTMMPGAGGGKPQSPPTSPSGADSGKAKSPTTSDSDEHSDHMTGHEVDWRTMMGGHGGGKAAPPTGVAPAVDEFGAPISSSSSSGAIEEFDEFGAPILPSSPSGAVDEVGAPMSPSSPSGAVDEFGGPMPISQGGSGDTESLTLPPIDYSSMPPDKDFAQPLPPVDAAMDDAHHMADAHNMADVADAHNMDASEKHPPQEAPSPSGAHMEQWSGSPSPPVYETMMPPSPTPSPTPSLPPRPPPHIPEPKATVYKGKSGSIVATLEALLQKASARLDELQGAEATAIVNYKMLKSSLLTGMEASKKDMTEAKATLPEKTEAKTVAEGELQALSKDLASDVAGKEVLHHECLTAAEEYQAATMSRNTELKALADAKEAIQETKGAEVQTYLIQRSETSLVQRAAQTQHSGESLAKFQSVRFVRHLASELGSASLAQLASQMSSALKLGNSAEGTSGDDSFAKVKDLLANMIAKLSSEADTDASLKVYCDKEMSAVMEKKDDSTTQQDRLNTHVDQKRAKASKLRGDISMLQRELAALAEAQSVASQIRLEEHKAFLKDKTEMEQGLKGVKLAVRVLKEHYGQDATSNLIHAKGGSSGGIIGLLEIVEMDFSRGLAELVVAEEAAASYFASAVKPNNAVEAAAKQHDLKLKMKDFANTNKAAADLSNDAGLVSERVSAINRYEEMLKSKCSKSDTFEERKKRREKELAGLKDAFTSLAGETLLFQMDSTHRLRGAQRHTT